MRTNRMLSDDVGGLDIFMLMARALTPPGMTPQPGAYWDRYDVPATPVEPSPPKLGWAERLERWFWRQRQRDLKLGHRSRVILQLQTQLARLRV